MIMKTDLLGGLTPQQFLAEYWQKKPLLVRNAVPGFTGLLSPADMMTLAADENAEARLVEFKKDGWHLSRSPFSTRDLAKKRKHPWTVLLQGLNLELPQADEFMRRFDFIPFSRLDDLMVSYAVDQGGVGPHFDDYDVFLIQGIGQRRWRIGPQRDKSLVEGAPLKILKNFEPAEDWILNPGDLLYLPPHWAHDGIAVGECMTYSVGFRSPATQELADEFLTYLQERIDLDGIYADPDLQFQEHPAEISKDMVSNVANMIARIQWDNDDIRNFIGCWLTEPKPQVYFEPPEEEPDFEDFVRRVQRHGVRLNTKSQLLFSENFFFINGEPVSIPIEDQAWMRALADQRAQPASPDLTSSTLQSLFEWYSCGFVWSA